MCDIATAEKVAEKLKAAIAAATFETVDKITCSFGVAEFHAGDSAQSLVARADEALYRAKAKGRNRVECARPKLAAE
jgi:diguanylate cyclase (GGDEF)-like protein